MNLITKYFPGLSEQQMEQFSALGDLYRYWNERINVVSRQDLDNLYERHILHSLGIASVFSFIPGTKIMDAGTGGGFPGIPLAIYFPEVKFHLVDATRKKIQVVREISEAIGLNNLTSEHCRLEDHHKKYDFVVSRAVKSLPVFYPWIKKNISHKSINTFPNGIIYLKGGDFVEELKNFNNSRIHNLSDNFEEEFFETKRVVHIF